MRYLNLDAAQSVFLDRQLEHVTGTKQDPCVLDTFRAAVAQALDPNLAPEKCVWWYYSRQRRTPVCNIPPATARSRRFA